MLTLNGLTITQIGIGIALLLIAEPFVLLVVTSALEGFFRFFSR